MKTTGTFVWHELMTQDPEAAVSFYGELFGWRFKRGDAGPMPYHEFFVGEHPIGGITGLMGATPQPTWGAYVTVDQIEAAADRACRHGGAVCVPPMDIPGTGRFAALADPTGAQLMPFVYAGDEPDKSNVFGQPGTFLWNELLTDDVPRAARFYGEVFGWSTREQDMGPIGTYTLFGREGRDVAGAMKRPAALPANQWLYYVAVTDVDQKLAQAQARGATALGQPMDIPGIGRMVQLKDPQGALLALFKPQR